jgi:hypothetical protein
MASWPSFVDGILGPPACEVASSSSRGAAQPASLAPMIGSASLTSQPAKRKVSSAQPLEFVLGFFNFGIRQSMLRAGQPSFQTHMKNFTRVVAKLVEEGMLDILFGSEVGGFEQGFSKAGMNAEDFLQEPFANLHVIELDNTLAMWGFGGASQPVEVTPHGTPQIHRVKVGRLVHAAITQFIVGARGGASQPAKAFVVVGNLHIVAGKNPPTVATKRRIVDLLRIHLDTFTAPEAGMPIVRIIVGDDNFSTDQACQALQRERNEDPLWEVYPAVGDKNGDHISVSGATAQVTDIAVG